MYRRTQVFGGPGFSLRGDNPRPTLQPQSPSLLRLAIVGFGPTGHFTLREIIKLVKRDGNTRVELDIFDPRGFDGRGIHGMPANLSPSRMDAAHNLLLNTSANGTFSEFDMSDGYDFPSFAMRHGYKSQDFLPRYLLGEFMTQKTDELFSHASELNGTLKITTHRERVEEVDCSPSGRSYDHVFCSTGHPRTPVPEHLFGTPGFYKTLFYLPESDAGYQSMGKAKHALVIPGGFTSTMDVVRMAQDLGYQGEYTIISKSGFFDPNTSNPKIRNLPAWQLYHELLEQGRIEVVQERVDMQQVTYNAQDGFFNLPMADSKLMTAANLCNAAIWSETVMMNACGDQIITDPLMQSVRAHELLRMQGGTWINNDTGTPGGISTLGLGLSNPEHSPWSLLGCSEMCRKSVIPTLFSLLDSTSSPERRLGLASTQAPVNRSRKIEFSPSALTF